METEEGQAVFFLSELKVGEIHYDEEIGQWLQETHTVRKLKELK